MLSGYRLMWMMVMFDLPVVTPEERKAAHDFRLFLLDLGFERAQLSVYVRFCEGKERTTSLTRRIRERLPDGGHVDILFFTDKQFENIITFKAKVKQPRPGKPEQLTLF